MRTYFRMQREKIFREREMREKITSTEDRKGRWMPKTCYCSQERNEKTWYRNNSQKYH